MLLLKQSARGPVIELARTLEPHWPEIRKAWRERVAEEYLFDARVLVALERLTLEVTAGFLRDGNITDLLEHLSYYGMRLAKLQVDTRAVARALELFQGACEPHITRLWGARKAEAMATLEALASATFVSVSGAYYDAQKNASASLLSILDAELSAINLEALLERVLRITAATFNARVGVALLYDREAGRLHVTASVGLEGEQEESIGAAEGFSGMIAQSGEPAMLADLENCDCVLSPALKRSAKAIWGVPLRSAEEVIGVLLIGFDKTYEWLPTERELLRAVADRSAMAIERARMTDALREREQRIAQLSAHLLAVQEEERKRISRELHDETGQALMVIRLYLGMLEQAVLARGARAKIRETVEVVDRTIEGIRRIIGRLSPLVLQELGLIAALRKEAKDLAKGTGVKARVAVHDNVGRLAPEMETAIYRVVQEALHNVAKHAQAKNVNIQLECADGTLRLLVEDDGVGFSPARGGARRQSFGLAGIKERVAMLGGTLKVNSTRGRGTRLEISVPAQRPGAENGEEGRTRAALVSQSEWKEGSAAGVRAE